MLGAVRHNGFIPWDDDIDIAMLRDDYNRFVSIVNDKIDSEYQFQCLENTPRYPYNFGKVFKVNSVFVERFTANQNILHGIYIDVFPMDYVDINHARELHIRRKLISKYTQARYAKMKMIKVNKIKQSIATSLPLSFINKRASYHMLYNYKKGNMVQKLCHYGKNKPPVKASLFTDTIHVPFEEYSLPIPREFDSFLKERYGNYMEYPSIEQQVPAHNIIEVRL